MGQVTGLVPAQWGISLGFSLCSLQMFYKRQNKMFVLFCRQNSSNEVRVALMLKEKSKTQPDIKILQCTLKPLSWSCIWRFCQVAAHVSRYRCSWNNLGHCKCGLVEVCNLLKLSQLGWLGSYSTWVHQEAELQLAQSLGLDKPCVPAPEGEVFLRLRNSGCSSV